MSETINTPRRPDAAETGDPIRDLVDRLNSDATKLANKDPELSRSIRQLADAAEKPGRTDSPSFRTLTAYALQDMEKLGGPISTVPAALRAEMTERAATAPGLLNERLQDLVRSTRSLDDTQLVRDIRKTAMDVAFQGGDQSSKSVMERVETLENRSRLTTGTTVGVGPAGPERSDRVKETGLPTQSTIRSPAADEKPKNSPEWRDDPSTPQKTEQTSLSTNRSFNNNSAPGNVSSKGSSIASLALSALVQHMTRETNDIRGQATSLLDRVAKHGDSQQQIRDEGVMHGAERSQRAALDALQAFEKGAGSSIMTKIQDAAKSEPGGLQAVLSEMREGGRFSSLRSQFNADLAIDRGMGAAYDKVASSLQQYSGDRAAVEAIGARRGTTQALQTRFETMDAEIGKATSAMPSRTDGKSVVEDLGEKIRELLDRAVQAVKSAFTPGPRASSGPSPSP